MKCVRCGRPAKLMRVVSWENKEFLNYKEYGRWWLVDNERRYEADNETVVEKIVPLCKKCSEGKWFLFYGIAGSWILLDGKVAVCKQCGKRRYGASDSHLELMYELMYELWFIKFFMRAKFAYELS